MSEVTLATLRDLPLCASFSPDELAGLAGLARPREFHAGEWLLRQGEIAASTYVLLEGEADILRALPGGGEIAVGSLSAGDTLGEIGLLARQRRLASVRARVAVRALEFEHGVFEAAWQLRQPAAYALHAEILRLLSRQVRRLASNLAAALPPAAPWAPAPPETPDPAFDYVRFLPLLRCAGTLGQTGLQQLARLSTPRWLVQGETLLEPDNCTSDLALVVRGALELVGVDPHPGSALLVLGPGALAGLPAAVDGESMSVLTRAREHSLVLVLARRDWALARERGDEFAYALARTVGEELADMLARLANRSAQHFGLARAQALLTRSGSQATPLTA